MEQSFHALDLMISCEEERVKISEMKVDESKDRITALRVSKLQLEDTRQRMENIERDHAIQIASLSDRHRRRIKAMAAIEASLRVELEDSMQTASQLRDELRTALQDRSEATSRLSEKCQECRAISSELEHCRTLSETVRQLQADLSDVTSVNLSLETENDKLRRAADILAKRCDGQDELSDMSDEAKDDMIATVIEQAGCTKRALKVLTGKNEELQKQADLQRQSIIELIRMSKESHKTHRLYVERNVNRDRDHMRMVESLKAHVALFTRDYHAVNSPKLPCPDVTDFAKVQLAQRTVVASCEKKDPVNFLACIFLGLCNFYVDTKTAADVQWLKLIASDISRDKMMRLIP